MKKLDQLSHSVFGENKENSIIFLHGFMGSKEDWQFLVNELQKSFYCILIDLPGHGKNIPDNIQDYSLDKCADIIISLLNKLNIRKCGLVGYSMGGRTGLFTLLKYPEYFRKIVLESVNPGIEDEIERANRAENDKKTADRIVNDDINTFLNDWYSQPLFGNISENEDYPRLIKNRSKNDREGLSNSLHYMGTGMQPPLWSRIPEIKSEILYIAGGLDNKYVQIGSRLKSIKHDLKLEIIEKAGHNTHFQQPGIFVEKVTEYFTQQEV
ncbi:MAG: 2-succinyl-6-hydroxy-2,4-cyclohexadiene-1-carboxylate synthase [bacterium]|nr:2-succinyl-6-hydroxy-2,4-cyclohexadiene-1-carboxylate synthase [bacterium]